ncbi:MAG TPA: hypothetical protein VFA20_28835 [Myxococcaceae bacterium]|nr:hypothetical protein [Myxococcaceae bacterium]
MADLWLQPGDILVERANTPELVGTSCLYKGSSGWAIFPDLLIRVRVANEKILPEYLEAFLRSQEARHYFMNAAQGTAGSMPKIDQSSIERLDIPLPPFAEQRRIVAKVQVLLARVSAARERLEKVPILLKRFRQAVLAKAFRGELVPTEAELAAREGRSFQSAVELLGQPTDAVNDELPEGWAEMPFRSLLRVPLRNGHSAKASGKPSGVRTLTLSAVTYGLFTEANTKLTVADPEKVTDLWLEAGDILIERANTPELVGTARLYRGPKRWAIFPDLIIRARIADRFAAPEYVELFLQSESTRRYFQEAAQGTAGSMPKIDQGAVERLRVALPPLTEQRRIVFKVEALLAAAAKVEAEANRQLRVLERAPQAILQKAFAGELVPTEAELASAEGRSFESAEELLHHVAATPASRHPAEVAAPRAKQRGRPRRTIGQSV